MSCDCESYICLEAFANPCSEGVEIDVEATYTGDITGRVYFNGISQSFTVGVTEGENIIIPSSVLNENYTHELRLYNGSSLLNCYHLKVTIDVNSGDFPVPESTGNTLQGASFTGNGTDTQAFPILTGQTLFTISMGGQEYTSEYFTQTGTFVTWSNYGVGLTFTGVVALNWKKS